MHVRWRSSSTTDGKLIKRPLALGDGVALIGFDEAALVRSAARTQRRRMGQRTRR
ncbi:MAG TPA: hypothetical protein VF469_04360 [Kofleriaceae bacterium]